MTSIYWSCECKKVVSDILGKVVVVSSSKLYLFKVTHFSNTILVSHETLRIIYNIFTMKEYYIYNNAFKR